MLLSLLKLLHVEKQKKTPKKYPDSEQRNTVNFGIKKITDVLMLFLIKGKLP